MVPQKKKSTSHICSNCMKLLIGCWKCKHHFHVSKTTDFIASSACSKKFFIDFNSSKPYTSGLVPQQFFTDEIFISQLNATAADTSFFFRWGSTSHTAHWLGLRPHKGSVVEPTHGCLKSRHYVDPELPAFRDWRCSGKVVGLHDETN